HWERHFPTEHPAEDLYRRPVPSTSCPCPAWFSRRQSPLFRGSEATVEKGLVPPQPPLLVQPLSNVRHAFNHTPSSPMASAAASTSRAKEPRRVKPATLRRSGESTGCLRNRLGWVRADALADPLAVSAEEARLPPTPSAHRSTASAGPS